MKPPQLSDKWSPEVQRVYEHDMREIWDPKIAPQVWNQYHAQLDLYLKIAEKLQPASILDIGCAQATLAMLLAERGYRVVANDLREDFLDYAKSRYERGNIDFVAGNVFETDIPGPFDLVFANQIIEHLVYPVEFLDRLKKLVRPSGHVVVTTPNHGYFRNSLPRFEQLGDVKQYENRQYTADADGHFFAYTSEELSSCFTKAGYVDIRPFFFETPWISGHAKIRYLHSFTPAGLLTAPWTP